MGYVFEWDSVEAASKAREHGVTFDEASTVFADVLALLKDDPDHSRGEERYLLLGMSSQERLSVVPSAKGRRSAQACFAPEACLRKLRGVVLFSRYDDFCVVNHSAAEDGSWLAA